MNGSPLACAIAAALALAGCVHQRVELMTSRDLSMTPGTSALVAYLGQPDADPEVCTSAGARLHDAYDLAEGLTGALVAGKVPPQVWGACIDVLLPRLDPARAAEVVEDIIRAAAETLAIPRAEGDPRLRSRRLQALERVYLERAPGGGASEAASRALDEARQVATGPEELRAAGGLAVGLELERGRWRGRPVDTAALHAMASEVGVVLLLRAARRLPDPALRSEAERLVVRQRIVASPFSEVRAAAATVESVVLRRGTNPLSLGDHPPLHATLAADALPRRTVVVRQRPIEDVATLLARPADRSTPSVTPPISLGGAVQVEVAGLSLPVTLCAPGRVLDPTPCIAPSDVTSGSPLARVRGAGDLRIEEQVNEAAAVSLARRGSEVRIPLFVGQVPAGALVWPVAFERPPQVVLSGRRPGEVGPALTVTVERLDATHLAFRADGWERSVSAVVEVGDVRAFRVVSRGAPGADGRPGSDGSDGSSGFDGTPASCPSFSGSGGSRGGDGSSGQDGGHGSPGGRGGDVRVVVISPGQRDDTLELARASIASEGGPGGRGGRGGHGGRGGSGGLGGSGTTCTDADGHTTSLAGGMSGPSGLDGSNGMDGLDGPKGPPGVVRFEAAPSTTP